MHTGSDNFQSEFHAPRWACGGISFSICTHCPSDMCYKAPCLSPLLAGTLHRTGCNRTRDETTNNNQHYTIRNRSTAPCSVSVLARRRQNRLFLSCPDNSYVRPPVRGGAALNSEHSRVAEKKVLSNFYLLTRTNRSTQTDRPCRRCPKRTPPTSPSKTLTTSSSREEKCIKKCRKRCKLSVLLLFRWMLHGFLFPLAHGRKT